jgi:predicted nucleic acid-binding protein
MNLVLDTGVLGQLCHSTQRKNRPVVEWLASRLDDELENRIFVPEICDYELRRKLLHLISKGEVQPRSIDRLNELINKLEYLSIDTQTMRLAAELWAKARATGVPTADEKTLDGDVILAAQAQRSNAIMVTNNVKHLSRYGVARHWSELQTRPKGSIPYVEGVVPPQGYIQAQVKETGELVWIKPSSIVADDEVRSQLSSDQIERSRWIWEQLREVYAISFDEFVFGFQQDESPEPEIAVWERIASVYVLELRERPNANFSERQLLFKVIRNCSMTSNLDEILSTAPEAKGLPNLARVESRFRGK